MDTYPVYKGESFFREGLPIYLNIATEGFREDTLAHTHDFTEIAYVNSGTGIHSISGTEYNVEKGDICVISPGTLHVFCSTGRESGKMLTVYNCLFRHEFIAPSPGRTGCSLLEDDLNAFFEFLKSGQPYINLKLKASEQAETESIYRKMHQEYFSMLEGYTAILHSCLIEMVIRIIRYMDHSGEYREERNNKRKDMLAAAFDFMKSNYRSPNISVNELAARSFLSRSYFSRLFISATGQSFTKYLQNLRISEACRLLKTTDKKVTDIMLDVGMKDIKHFNRLFKDLTGKTPREFR